VICFLHWWCLRGFFPPFSSDFGCVLWDGWWYPFVVGLVVVFFFSFFFFLLCGGGVWLGWFCGLMGGSIFFSPGEDSHGLFFVAPPSFARFRPYQTFFGLFSLFESFSQSFPLDSLSKSPPLPRKKISFFVFFLPSAHFALAPNPFPNR